MTGFLVAIIIGLIITLGAPQNRVLVIVICLIVAFAIGLINPNDVVSKDLIATSTSIVDSKSNIPPFDYQSGISFMDFTNMSTNQASNPTEIEWIPTNSAKGYGFKLRDKVVFYAKKYQIQPELFVALVTQESQWKVGVVSPKGAVGLTQLMPETGKRFGCQPNERTDPDKNIECGAKYFRWLLNRFKGDERLALAGYNAGENAVARYNGIPPYEETRNYVKNITAHRDRMVKKNWLVASSS